MPVGKRSEVTPEDTYSAFDTNEAFKSVAKRLGTSPNTLRKWWIAKFGQEVFEARGKRLHSAAGTRTGLASAGKARTYQETSEPCSKCGQSVTLTVLQKSRLNRVLCTSCEEAERGVDRHCPVCGFGCVGEKGLSGHMARPQHGDPEAHAVYLKGQADAVWQGKAEGQDFVTCLICGHRGVRIDRHLLAEHGLSVDAYRLQHLDAAVQAETLVDRRVEGLHQYHQDNPRTGLLKLIRCPSCGDEHEVGLTFASANLKCPECREEERWAGKSEDQDYVTCQVCGHRAESLVSHIRNVHPELEGHYQETFPGALVTALDSDIRNKEALKGKPLSEETKAKMSANAGRWNKGLTKETDPRMAQAALNMLGRKAWRKGLTKEDHPGVMSTSVKMREVRAIRHWTNGTEVTLTREQLLPFALKNGKISVGQAIAALGHAFVIIRRECWRHGLTISHVAVAQAICLETLAQLFGGAPYKTEWNDASFVNPKTGRRLRFDGYFPAQGLVVEFHGAQHFRWPNHLGMSAEDFCDMQERDRLKENLIHSDPVLRYFLVREDEPYTDPDYLRGRLIDEGFLGL